MMISLGTHSPSTSATSEVEVDKCGTFDKGSVMRRILPVTVLLGLSSVACEIKEKCVQPVCMDCDNTFDYDSRDFATKITASKVGSIELGTSQKAIREVDASVERFAGRWNTLCREWNAGAIDQASFQSQTQAIRTKMERLDELTLILAKATDEATFQMALREAYGSMLGDQPSTVDLALQLGVSAQRPGEPGFEIAADGATLPTGTKVKMTVNANTPAYLYMYQVDPSGAISVLFPDPRIEISNPLLAGADLVVPPSGTFDVNDKDIGTEQVHVVASINPMPQLASAVGQAAASPTAVTAEELDCASARGLEYKPADGCPTSRGLGYVADPSMSGYSAKAVNAAGDDAVHLIYRFEHTAG